VGLDLDKAIREEIATLVGDLGIDERRAFALWYAHEALGLPQALAREATACAEAGDRDLDLVYLDHDWTRLVIAQVEYAPAGAPPPSSSRLTVLLNRITELADLDELRATGQTPLIEAGEKLREARGKGYAIELQLVHFGPRQAELDRLARSFNRRNLRDDVSVAIVSGTELAELKQERVRALQPTHDAHPIVEEELIEETAALRRPFDDPNHRLTMPIPRGDQLEASFEDETLTGSYELPLDDADGPQAVLVVQAGSRLGEMVRIGGALVLGRGTRARYRIDDAGISREHCSIARSGEGVFSLADLNSRNGTFVNGRRVKQALLRNGDKIRIGAATVLKFTLADEIDENFQQRMYDAALRDPLTGLYNRRHLMEQMEKEFAFSQRHGGPVSLLLLDIDHFKSRGAQRGGAADPQGDPQGGPRRAPRGRRVRDPLPRCRAGRGEGHRPAPAGPDAPPGVGRRGSGDDGHRLPRPGQHAPPTAGRPRGVVRRRGRGPLPCQARRPQSPLPLRPGRQRGVQLSDFFRPPPSRSMLRRQLSRKELTPDGELRGHRWSSPPTLRPRSGDRGFVAAASLSHPGRRL
jgi:hypothetical protein